MFGDVGAYLFDKLKQYFVRGDGARLDDEPFLPLLEYAGEIELLEYDKAPADWVVFLEISYQNGISTAEDGQPRKLVVAPLAVDVLSVGDIEEGLTMKLDRKSVV